MEHPFLNIGKEDPPLEEISASTDVAVDVAATEPVLPSWAQKNTEKKKEVKNTEKKKEVIF